MRWVLLFAMLCGLGACADIPPENSGGGRHKVAAGSCARDAGRAGICIESTNTRPDCSSGVPPKMVSVKILRCEGAKARANEKSSALVPLLGGVAMGLLLLSRRWFGSKE